MTPSPRGGAPTVTDPRQGAVPQGAHALFQRAALVRETMPTLRPPCLENRTATPRPHPGAKPVDALSLASLRLKRLLHGIDPRRKNCPPPEGGRQGSVDYLKASPAVSRNTAPALLPPYQSSLPSRRLGDPNHPAKVNAFAPVNPRGLPPRSDKSPTLPARPPSYGSVRVFPYLVPPDAPCYDYPAILPRQAGPAYSISAARVRQSHSCG